MKEKEKKKNNRTKQKINSMNFNRKISVNCEFPVKLSIFYLKMLAHSHCSADIMSSEA